jgi:hypothetical protein
MLSTFLCKKIKGITNQCRVLLVLIPVSFRLFCFKNGYWEEQEADFRFVKMSFLIKNIGTKNILN